MITFQSPAVPVSVKSFESMIPALTERFRRACRSMRSEDDCSDAVQEMMGLAFIAYRSLVERKLYDNIYSSPLGEYSVKKFFTGRRVVGQNSRSIGSPRCSILGRAEVQQGLLYFCRKSRTWKEILERIKN